MSDWGSASWSKCKRRSIFCSSISMSTTSGSHFTVLTSTSSLNLIDFFLCSSGSKKEISIKNVVKV